MFILNYLCTNFFFCRKFPFYKSFEINERSQKSMDFAPFPPYLHCRECVCVWSTRDIYGCRSFNSLPFFFLFLNIRPFFPAFLYIIDITLGMCVDIQGRMMTQGSDRIVSSGSVSWDCFRSEMVLYDIFVLIYRVFLEE